MMRSHDRDYVRTRITHKNRRGDFALAMQRHGHQTVRFAADIIVESRESWHLVQVKSITRDGSLIKRTMDRPDDRHRRPRPTAWGALKPWHG